MISVEEALDKVLSQVSVLDKVRLPLLDCLGLVLAEDVSSPIDVPSLDNSAMDGFAVRAEDTGGASPASPRTLAVIGEVAAGRVSQQEVVPGTAIRIMTGAPVPPGSDAVVQFEDTDEAERKQAGRGLVQVTVFRQVNPGLNIRLAGEDIARGAVVLRQGTVLRPAHIGVLASVGLSSAPVIRRPVVAVLATGDELLQVGEAIEPGKIYNSNTYSIAAQVIRYGGIPKLMGIARDNKADLAQKLRAGLDADLFITSGGVSAGDYDVVKDVLGEEGEIGFWKVRMKPGKPLAFGVLQGKGSNGKPRSVAHLGLPGYPVSSMVTFELFARPAIMKMQGKRDLARPTVEAILEDKVVNRDGRRVFLRAVVTRRNGQYYARLSGSQGSGILTAMAQANALAIVSEEVTEARPGDRVQAMMLDWECPDS
ncbi:MAG: molybdopterin molybdotransferase MoeA [Chloroflexi bacterium]|nr:molybdopterin molybdotransferase MoeA [Chloroflexota bacterium]